MCRSFMILPAKRTRPDRRGATPTKYGRGRSASILVDVGPAGDVDTRVGRVVLVEGRLVGVGRERSKLRQGRQGQLHVLAVEDDLVGARGEDRVDLRQGLAGDGV